MPDVPGVPSAEELAALPHEELAVRLSGGYRLIAEMTPQLEELSARMGELSAENERLASRVEALERRAGRDSSTSSKPPSSDSPYKKRPRDRSLREKGKRRPGKQPGEPGTTMKLVDNPKYRFWYPPAECRECGTGLAGEEVFAQRRHQVTDILPTPAPEVTEHAAQSKMCPCCGAVTEGELPAGVRARASFGSETHAQAANLTCGNFIPAGRAAALMAELTGARDAARDARAGGKKVLDPDILGDLTSRYRAIATSGLAGNVCRHTPTAKDARRIARRFLKHEDMILRFITRPDPDIFTNNEAERTIRPVKVAQRASGGCWRTLDGLADFAVVQSYLSTAAKWGIAKIDALRGLFNGTPWMPPGIEPKLTG